MSDSGKFDGKPLDPRAERVYSRAAGRRARLQTELEREIEDFRLSTTDPERLFGPNGDDVRAVLDALPTIHVGLAWAITYSCYAVPYRYSVAAQAAVKDQRRGAWASELWMAEHEVSDWLQALRLVGEPLKLYEVVATAGTNAVDALVLEKVISDADFTALYWPWSQVLDAQAPDERAVDRRLRMANQGIERSADGARPSGSRSDPSRSELLADLGSRAELDSPAELDEEIDQTDLTRIDPIERYGPHGDEVEAFMVALDDIGLDNITSDDLRRLDEAWKSVDGEAATAVLSAVEDYRTKGKFIEFLDAAEMDVEAWHHAVSATDKEAELDRVVVEAARDAVDALILQDELDDDEFDLLYGPWADVMDPIEEVGVVDAAEPEEVAPGTEEEPDEGFGPNAPAVRALIATMGLLASADFRNLAAAFNRQRKDELDLAHDAVRELVASDPIWRDRVVAAQDWVASYLRPPLGLVATHASDRLHLDKAMALPPAIDAVTALVLGDILDSGDAATLFGPWAEVMEALETVDEGEGDES